MRVRIFRSTRAGKKWMAAIQDGPTVHFGESEKHMAAYLLRHKARETWTMKGVESAGFWARWLLWNKHSLRASVADIQQRFTNLSVSLPTSALAAA